MSFIQFFFTNLISSVFEKFLKWPQMVPLEKNFLVPPMVAELWVQNENFCKIVMGFIGFKFKFEFFAYFLWLEVAVFFYIKLGFDFFF